MRSVSLLELRNLVRSRADIEYDTARHRDASINSEINLAIVELRNALASDGSELYIGRNSWTMDPVRAVDGANYAELPVPSDADRVLGIDFIYNDILMTLESVSLRDRIAFDPSATRQGIPLSWSLIDAETIAIQPVPDAPYEYTIWYHRQYNDMLENDDTFDVLPGFTDWIVWRAVEKIAIRDDLESLKRDARMGMAEAYRSACDSAISRRSKSGHRKDTRGARNRLSSDPIMRWRMR